MTRSRLNALATALLLTALLLLVCARQNRWDVRSGVLSVFKPAPPEAPDDRVYKMLDAARQGNLKDYLDCFSGRMRDELLQSVTETSATHFSKYLRDQNAAITGVAITVKDNSNSDNANIRVEYVYRLRNEVQDFYLHKRSGKWTIVRVAGSEQIKTLIPFGTAVTD